MKQLFWCSLICFAGLHTTVAQIKWAKWMPGDASHGLFIAADKSGDTYVAGQFYGTITIDQHVLTSRGDSDVFVLALEKDGDVKFVTSFGGPSTDYPTAMAVKPDGDLFVAARIDAGVELPQGDVSTMSGACVVKFDHGGDVNWTRILEDANATVASMLTEHGNKELWLCGYASDGIFITAWNKKGIEQIRNVTDVPPLLSVVGDWPAASNVPRVAIDRDHNLLISGGVTHAITIGTNEFYGSGDRYAPQIVAKHVSNGDWLWAEYGFPSLPTYTRAIAVGPDGSVLTTGYAMLPYYYSYSGLRYNSLFVTQHSAEGELLGTLSRGEYRGWYDGLAVASDRNGNAYVAGYALGYYLSADSRGSAYVIGPGFEYRISSQNRWQENRARGICVDDEFRVYVTGDFQGAATFGTNVLGGGYLNTTPHVFVMRLDDAVRRKRN